MRHTTPTLALAVLLLGVLPGAAVAQRDTVATSIVQGTVVDTVTGRPIPFAIVRVAETDVSTLTNRRGRYRIAVPTGEGTLQFRKIGYRMVAVSMVARSTGDVFMHPLPVELAGITVTAEADDPARRIISQAIARKNDILSRIHDYRYDAYIKFIVRDLDKPEDSTESVVLLTETQTTAYWEKPDRYQETITGRRQTRNLAAENNLVSVGEIVNFNKNRIDLQKYAVVSPTADDALDHYDYHLVDTLYVGGRTVFRLAIEPKSQVVPLFVGMIDVADSTFDVMSIDVGTNDAVRFDFFENLRYRQRLGEFGDDMWMPQEIRFSGELHVGIPIPGFPEHISFLHVASLGDFRFDEGNRPDNLGEYIVVVDEKADDVDSTTWEDRRASPLTRTESAAFARIDSLESLPRSLGAKLATGTLGTLFLSMNPDFFHFNRVEGAYLGAGVTLRDLSPDLVLRAKAGYAFDRDEWQHNFGIQYRLWERQRLWVGATYQDGIVRRPTIISSTYNPTYIALFSKVDPLDYYDERGFTAAVSTKVFDFTRLQLQYNDLRQKTAEIVNDYAIFAPNKTQRPNPMIAPGTLRSLSGSLTFDTRKLLKRKGRDFFFNSLIYTRITLSAEYASPDLLDSDFDFLRYYLHVHRRQRTFNIGLTTIDAFAGSSARQLPPQRYFTIDFGNGVFFEGTGLNTLNSTNFVGNRAAMVYANHDFGQQLFQRSGIPLIRRLPFSVSVHGGVFWTDLTGQSANPGDDVVYTAPTPYSEIGFGIGNLTPMFQPFNFSVWFTWQLSSYDTDGFKVLFGVPGQ